MEKGISGNGLKKIAVITMLADHIGAVLVERAMLLEKTEEMIYRNLQLADGILRSLGRISFPIFCFLLTEGFLHTKNLPKYMMRMAVFAIVSEIPFDLAFSGKLWNVGSQNVFFTLLVGLAVMGAMEQTRKREKIPRAVGVCLCILWGILGCAAAEMCHTDYGARGVFAILLLYLFRSDRLWQVFCGAVAFSWEVPAPLAFLPVLWYNGSRGRGTKIGFYLFYPLHLLVLYLAAVFLGLA